MYGAHRLWAALGGALVILATAACSSSPDAEQIGIDHSPDTGSAGYCRTTTCTPPQGYPIPNGACQPPDWSDSDACVNVQKASNAPLWWRTSCVGYDLNEAASTSVSLDAFTAAASSAFEAWATASCPTNGSGTSRVDIDVRDLGPVSCALATYDKTGGPNQNVIVFHDDAWPYEAADRAKSHTKVSQTVALTTVTFEPNTGEIFDADIELNSADYKFGVPDSTSTTLPSGVFDLQSVLTHETGHFLGLGHSPLLDAVMNPSGDSDQGGMKRALRAEDVAGICSIYPSGARRVSTLVDPSGEIPAGDCDPTPRHGFSRTCGGY
jgi:hypothetical protein